MSHFITPKHSNGGKSFIPIQLNGVDGKTLTHSLMGRHVVAIEMPRKQTMAEAWILRLLFEDGGVADFSSEPVELSCWQEAGKLKVDLRSSKISLPLNFEVFRELLGHFCVHEIEQMVFEDSELLVECGLVLLSRGGLSKLTVAIGVSPGSVTCSMDSYENIRPLFPVDLCRRESIAN